MIGSNGKNDFKGCFDTLEWSAPCYEDPTEIIGALAKIPYKGKKIKSIRIIGIAQNVGDTDKGILQKRIVEAGFPLEDNRTDTYPYLYRIRVPWKVEAYEPIQFVFEDDTTLEILPTDDGGARIAANTVPLDIKDGINHSNFNADLFWNELRGKTLEDIRVYADKANQEIISEYTLENGRTWMTRRVYELRIILDYPWSIDIAADWHGWYRITVMNGLTAEQIPYERVKAALNEDGSICIANGRGTEKRCLTYPKGVGDEDDYPKDSTALTSVDAAVADEFLHVFLRRYYDARLQPEQEKPYPNQYIKRESTVYSVRSIKQMIADMRSTASLLSKNHDDPSLAEIISRFSWLEGAGKGSDQLTIQEIFEWRKKRIPVAIDFYERFAKRLEDILELPGTGQIAFEGPVWYAEE